MVAMGGPVSAPGAPVSTGVLAAGGAHDALPSPAPGGAGEGQQGDIGGEVGGGSEYEGEELCQEEGIQGTLMPSFAGDLVTVSPHSMVCACVCL